MLPFYISKTLLFYNKTMFKDAGIAGPPQTFESSSPTPRGWRRAKKPDS